MRDGPQLPATIPPAARLRAAANAGSPSRTDVCESRWHSARAIRSRCAACPHGLDAAYGRARCERRAAPLPCRARPAPARTDGAIGGDGIALRRACERRGQRCPAARPPRFGRGSERRTQEHDAEIGVRARDRLRRLDSVRIRSADRLTRLGDGRLAEARGAGQESRRLMPWPAAKTWTLPGFGAASSARQAST